MSTAPDPGPTSTPPGSQTVHRALDVLEVVAATRRGLAVAEIAGRAGLSAPTAHRLCRTLVDRGYLRQLSDRSYSLGFRAVSLGAAQDLIGVDADDVLSDLVAEIGETANLAVLSGRQAEYVAQVPARYSMRMFTEIGRRVDLHSTGVGKALLAELSDEAIHEIVKQSGLVRMTSFTLSTEVALMAAVEEIRERGYATDEQEQELGVRCVAVPVRSRAVTGVALSVSGPVTRMTDEVLERAVPLLLSGSRRLAAQFDEEHAHGH